MSRRALASWFLVATAAGTLALLTTAAAAAWREAVRHAYWSGGLRRLCIALATDRTDAWAPWAFAAIAVAALVGWLCRPPPAPRALRGVALAVLAGAVGLRGAAALDRLAARRGPNLLVISIDTLRADRLGTYGAPRPTSPELDRRLAAEGVTLEQVFSQSPKTTPSHTTMFSSLYPCVHGVELWDPRFAMPNLNPRVHTLAEVLRNAGYTTAAYTGGAHMMGSRGLADGFELFVEGDGHELGPAARWIKHHRRQKWFLFFHTFQVHDPYVPPADLERRFAGGYDGQLERAVSRLRSDASVWDDRHRFFWSHVDRHDPATIRYLLGLYDAGIAEMDRSTVPVLLDTLARFALDRETLIVFLSDHGEAFGEHGGFLHDDLYATTLHVPLILRWPGRLPEGRRVPEPVRLVDVMPTILDLLGVRGPAAMQGRSLVPLVMGTTATGAAAAGPPPPIFSEYRDPTGAIDLAAVRHQGHSYLADGSTARLFDLVADPGEDHDVAAANPGVTAALGTDLARWRNECRTLAATLGPVDAATVPRPEVVDQLRALGYVD